MKKIRLISLIVSIYLLINIFSKLVVLYYSKASDGASDMLNIIDEKRGTPPYSIVLDKDLLPHIKVFFWVPANSNYYKAFADKGVKTYVIGHGSIEDWTIKETPKTSQNLKLVYVYVPKTFMLLYGKDFYSMIHLYYE